MHRVYDPTEVRGDYFQWKYHFNVSDISYEKLCKHLAISGIHIKSLRIIRYYLQSALSISIINYHHCINNCIIFVGKNLLRRRCQYCGTPWFHDDSDSAAESNYFDDVESYSRLTPSALYFYIYLMSRLKLLYANPAVSEKMRYSEKLAEDSWEDDICDV